MMIELERRNESWCDESNRDPKEGVEKNERTAGKVRMRDLEDKVRMRGASEEKRRKLMRRERERE